VTAVNVRHVLDLDVVLLMVANIPWQKEGTRAITPATDRLAMVEAAVEGVVGIAAGRWEIDRGGQSYTAETLEGLVQQWPDAEFFTIVGDDAAGGLQTWERLDVVCSLSRIVVVDRPGHDTSLVKNDAPGGDGERFIHVEVPRLEVSSTDLRARFADGRPLDYLITEPVLDVIRERSLYSESVGSAR
jgi:nicotinate-nucleotide adenylyltransferase